MFKKFRFTLFVLLWGVGLNLPYGVFIGWGMVAAGFVYLRLVIRKTVPVSTPPPPVELFTLPRLEFTGAALAMPEKMEKHLARLFRNGRIFYGEWLLSLLLMPICGLGFCLAGLFAGSAAGLIAAVLCAVNLLIFVPAAMFLHCSTRRFEAKRERLRQKFARPPFDFDDPQQRDHFCRHFDDRHKARVALRAVRSLGVDIMVYPEDALGMIAGKGKLPQLVELLESRQARTLGEWVERRVPGQEGDAGFGALPEENPAPLPPPEWPEELRKIIRREDGRVLPFKDREASVFLATRPLCTRELFASYWPTRREAEIAWVIRDIAIQIMARPENMMIYPNDPAALLDSWQSDSLEGVEFIMALEEHFDIVIPDGEAGKIFNDFNVREAVRYLIDKVD